jgi:hypothetical protein
MTNYREIGEFIFQYVVPILWLLFLYCILHWIPKIWYPKWMKERERQRSYPSIGTSSEPFTLAPGTVTLNGEVPAMGDPAPQQGGPFRSSLAPTAETTGTVNLSARYELSCLGRPLVFDVPPFTMRMWRGREVRINPGLNPRIDNLIALPAGSVAASIAAITLGHYPILRSPPPMSGTDTYFYVSGIPAGSSCWILDERSNLERFSN